MELNNIFSSLKGDAKDELNEVLLQNETLKIERILSTGQSSPKTGWYDQTQHEWVVVLKGEATLTFEDKENHMKAGDYLLIPAHTKHKVSWTHPQVETLWLAIHY